MDDIEYKRILVWSGWLRLSHWGVAISVLVLLMTGWVIEHIPERKELILDYHYIAASILLFSLYIRLYRMFAGKPHEKLGNLLPKRGEWQAAFHTLRFYISRGKQPVPRWYAQNPLWKPIYLVLYLMLILMAMTGLWLQEQDVLFGFYLPSVHSFWASILFWVLVLHIAAVMFHDSKGQLSDTSAMLNGYRIIFIDRTQPPSGQDESVQYFSLDDLKKKP